MTRNTILFSDSSEMMLLSNSTGTTRSTFPVNRTDLTTWNNFSDEKADLTLQDLNDEEVMRRLPSLIYLSVLIIIGFPGNLCVLIVFTKFYKESTYRSFILALASVDIIACGICMPFEIIETRFQYTFYAEIACKIFRTNNIVVSVSSIFILICLSIDRYRHVCQPLKVQMTVKFSKIICIVSVASAVFLSWPNVFFSGKRLVKLPGNLTGTDCSMSDEYRRSKLPFYHNVVLFLIFIVSILSISVIYILIGRKVFIHAKFRKNFLQTTSSSSSKKTTSTSASGSSRKSKKEDLPLEQRSPALAINNSIASPPAQNKNAAPPSDKANRKITKVAFAISLLFILSYLPYLILSTMTAVKGSFIAKPGPIVSAILPIVTRSIFINNVGNPIIYGFIDQRFRRSLKSLLTCFCCRK